MLRAVMFRGGRAKVEQTVQQSIGHAGEERDVRSASEGRSEAREHGDRRRDFLEHVVRREQLRGRDKRVRESRLRSRY